MLSVDGRSWRGRRDVVEEATEGVPQVVQLRSAALSRSALSLVKSCSIGSHPAGLARESEPSAEAIRKGLLSIGSEANTVVLSCSTCRLTHRTARLRLCERLDQATEGGEPVLDRRAGSHVLGRTR